MKRNGKPTTELQPAIPNPDPVAVPLADVNERTIRFTVDLPQSLHRKLSLLAAQQGRKKAAIVREWMERELSHL